MLGRLFGPAGRPTAPITPNDEFYVTSYRSPPAIRIKDWSLSLNGLVARPATFRHDEFLARPPTRAIVTLECIGNEVGDGYMGTAEWQGLSLGALLREAGIQPGAREVVFHGADGYADSISRERALAGDVLLAHTMNGVVLPEGHGFPVRAIVPGHYGMKSVQWLTGIEVLAQDYHGYYQRKGWSEDAIVQTMSRIDVPGHGDVLRDRVCLVQGLAFAGTRGISAVEFRIEEGPWVPATLAPPLAQAAWVFWSYRWRIAENGRYTLRVRAMDGAGRWQSELDRRPAPDGATGIHEVTVSVDA